jgi:hypothetical protein
VPQYYLRTNTVLYYNATTLSLRRTLGDKIDNAV